MRRAVAMKLCYVLDSHALLACFQKKLGGAAVRDLLRAGLEKKVILADLTR
jgi:PIN domain nuclease of toxin-antitoxin system